MLLSLTHEKVYINVQHIVAPNNLMYSAVEKSHHVGYVLQDCCIMPHNII